MPITFPSRPSVYHEIGKMLEPLTKLRPHDADHFPEGSEYSLNAMASEFGAQTEEYREKIARGDDVAALTDLLIHALHWGNSQNLDIHSILRSALSHFVIENNHRPKRK
jgi:hypothetical protein